MISVENLAAAASPETTLYVYWRHSMGLLFPRHGSLTAFRVMPLDSFFSISARIAGMRADAADAVT